LLLLFRQDYWFLGSRSETKIDMLRLLSTLFFAFVLALSALSPIVGAAAEPCATCAVGPQQSNHCDSGSNAIGCQPCAGGCLGQLATAAGLNGPAEVAREFPVLSPVEPDSVACEPSHAPPRL
jgi:hypothetical protein